MVLRHRPGYPQASVVKPPRSAHRLQRQSRCIWPGCGAVLAGDHAGLVCSCHRRSGYSIRQDRKADALVYHLLLAAYPFEIDLCDVLGTEDHDGVKDVVRRLRRWGHEITGMSRGYRYELPPLIAPERSPRARIVKPCRSR